MSVLDANVQKTPLAQSLSRAMGGKARDQVEQLGKVLPCTVSEVVSPWVVVLNLEVSYEGPLPRLTVPVLAPPYVAYPIQVGDAGLFLSSDLRLGQLTGIGGGGTPGLYDTPGNLSAGGFLWLGKAAWTTLDPEAVVVEGNLVVSADKLALYGGTKVPQPSVTGALSSVSDPAAKAVLTSIIAALAAAPGVNLAKDETT